MKIKHKISFFFILFTLLAMVIASQIDYRLLLNQKDVTISDQTLDYVATFKEKITSISTSFEVDPVTIAGIIAVEKTIGSDRIKSWQTETIKNRLKDKNDEDLLKILAIQKRKGTSSNRISYKILNELSWTLGICQISIQRAFQIEQKLSNIENRKERTPKEIIYSLLIPEENIKYCALEVSLISKYYQDSLNINLSKSPYILASAYNIGLDKIKRKYKNFPSSKPKANDFGKIIEKHEMIIKEKIIESENQETGKSK